MAITSCFAVNNTFCMEEDESDTSNTSDDEFYNNITSGMKRIRVNGKLFEVSLEKMMKYRVLRFFDINHTNQLEEEEKEDLFQFAEKNLDSEDNDPFKEPERNLKEEDAKIMEELGRDLRIAKSNNDNKMIGILIEIQKHMIQKMSSDMSKQYEKIQELKRESTNFYMSAFFTLTINGKNFPVHKSIFNKNKYPILSEFISSKNPFHDGYDFNHCVELTEKLKSSIEALQASGTSYEADKLKNIFLEIRSAIENAIRKLKPVNSTEAHEMTEYTRNILPGIIEEIESAYKEASQRE